MSSQSVIEKQITATLNRLWSDLYGDSIASIVDERAMAFQKAQKSLRDSMLLMEKSVKEEFDELDLMLAMGESNDNVELVEWAEACRKELNKKLDSLGGTEV